ncbi:dipeptide/oligopeptide/nickel ABC transporter permease/ATP-binding protein [Demequina sp. SYSU T00039]|uniref:Dipeptide/oligopeptide/nickel ABC transporter permease/ATP-binding protein n=1 Tax=Demequina lignilytica TaxID=3051663 RepID=A0AAW7M696_9MICO|nr:MULTISPECIES: dipeptide/oligopeptide/nickel ABC transporter permease/ATP-binding protein [unclassified Demequina]MDN4478968.1 dipeptide/oligopeptide/nickel ABC transporter permease/ATP-binding protein [Demequina sp. SYSU T00039-1]MDN4488843.1 dipeptide/oligopeptide/nickel ABC transporter permease/ATP-binding protein [Demequina sp. SYSU T00039]MDN4491444.1 dipeptide/oligopeptide/nickel ABC transporter permease/ATP-binding protein [Demequina sp. SYSU T00068]
MTVPTVGAPAASSPTARQAAGPRQLWGRLRHQPLTLVSAIVVLGVAVVAAFAPLLAPYAPDDTDFTAVFSPPTADHLLGTDDLGRDILSQLIFAARTAMVVAGGSVLVAMLIGVPFGLILGYKGGWYDRIGSRGMDVADALPGIMIGFVVIAILGRGMLILIFAIGLIFSMNFARVVRAITLTERKKLYVESARVSGLSHRQVIFGQVLPNLAGPLAVQGAVFLGNAIKVEAALSFLGLGLPDDQPSWGGMLRFAAEHQADHPLMAIPPGVAIVVTVLAFNLLGDGINDALSGRRRTRRKARKAQRLTLAAVEAARATSRAEHDARVAAAVAERDVVLDLRGVSVALDRPAGEAVPLLDDVHLTVRRGEVLGLLGESGSGKSMLARATLGMLPAGVRLEGGRVLLDGTDLTAMSDKRMRAIRGSRLAVVFQNPQSNLSPVHTVGRQLTDPIRAHHGMSKRDARARAAELLELVGVDDVQRRLDQYPHEFSGGMAQRVAIAIAIAGDPDVLILDEATSALDVTTQSQVLDLVLDLRERLGMAVIAITHDLGVVAETCDRVAVMYAGQIVEKGAIDAVFDRPRHPYTAALLAAHPAIDRDVDRLPTIPGRVPLAGEWPLGCHFAGRCAFATERCLEAPVALTEDVRCVRTDEVVLEGAHHD